MSPAGWLDLLLFLTNGSECFPLLFNSYVTINPTLCDCLLEKSEYQDVDSLKWDDLFSRYNVNAVHHPCDFLSRRVNTLYCRMAKAVENSIAQWMQDK